jgi:hypothetical protein
VVDGPERGGAQGELRLGCGGGVGGGGALEVKDLIEGCVSQV